MKRPIGVVLSGLIVAVAWAQPALAQASVPGSSSGGPGVEVTPSPEAVPRGAITFSEVPVGTAVRDQYIYKGIRFSGDGPSVVTDGSNATSPVLAGSPRFHGDIRGRFVLRGTTTARTVDKFSLDVGYINNPGSVWVTVYGAAGNRIGTITPSRTGVVRVISHIPNAASFLVHVGAGETAGVAIDNVKYPGVTITTGNLLINPGFESGSFAPWRPIATAANVNYATYSGPAKEGLRYAEFNVFPPAGSGSIGQDVGFAVHAGDIVTFQAWLRKPGCNGRYEGTLAIWTLDGPANLSSSRDFSIAPCAAWREVTVSHRVTADYATLRAEIYGRTLNENLDVDKASLTVNRAL